MLAIALVMLILGQTVLQTRLSGIAFLLYWLVCIVLTGVAIVIAFLDVRALQNRTRQEQEQLFASTLRRVETAVREKQLMKEQGLGTQYQDGRSNGDAKTLPRKNRQ